jgi:hypothetical protein
VQNRGCRIEVSAPSSQFVFVDLIAEQCVGWDPRGAVKVRDVRCLALGAR